MARLNRRRYPCVACRTPNATARVGAYCPTCRVEHRRALDRAREARVRTLHDRYLAREAKRRQKRAERVAAARAARQATLAAQMDGADAIALYRAEKAKRADQVTAWYAEARRRLDAERAA